MDYFVFQYKAVTKSKIWRTKFWQLTNKYSVVVEYLILDLYFLRLKKSLSLTSYWTVLGEQRWERRGKSLGLFRTHLFIYDQISVIEISFVYDQWVHHDGCSDQIIMQTPFLQRFVDLKLSFNYILVMILEILAVINHKAQRTHLGVAFRWTFQGKEGHFVKFHFILNFQFIKNLSGQWCL